MCCFPPLGFYSFTSSYTNPKHLRSLQTAMATLLSEKRHNLQPCSNLSLPLPRQSGHPQWRVACCSSKGALQPWRTIRAPLYLHNTYIYGLSSHYTFPTASLLQQTSFRLVWESLHISSPFFRAVNNNVQKYFTFIFMWALLEWCFQMHKWRLHLPACWFW